MKRSRNHRRRREGGFTMIEVMVALLLTAICVIGVTALFATEAKATGSSRHTTEATVLAEDKVEKLRTLGPAAVQSGTDTALDEKGKVGIGIYTRSWSETVSASYADISSTVSWLEDGVAKSVVLKARRNL